MIDIRKTILKISDSNSRLVSTRNVLPQQFLRREKVKGLSSGQPGNTLGVLTLVFALHLPVHAQPQETAQETLSEIEKLIIPSSVS